MKFFIKFTLFSFIVSGLAWFGVQWLDKQDSFAIKKIVLKTKLSQQNKYELLNITRQTINGNFFSLDIDKLRKSIESLPWIQQVSVRKVWSDSIHISVVEKKAVARWVRIAKRTNKNELKQVWDKQSLISKKGEIFTPKLSIQQQNNFTKLSLYSGPQKLSQAVMEKCQKYDSLLAKIQQKIVICALDKRRSWSLDITSSANKNPIKLILGNSGINELQTETKNTKDNRLKHHLVVQKINLFVSLYKKNLYKHRNSIQQIDMRYTNGFAITWKA